MPVIVTCTFNNNQLLLLIVWISTPTTAFNNASLLFYLHGDVLVSNTGGKRNFARIYIYPKMCRDEHETD